MTVSLQTLLDRSAKNIGDSHSVVKSAALELIKRAYKEGVFAQISEGYRSNSRQQELYNQGRTTGGDIVTNARPGTSYHNYGLAVDFFLVSKDGSDGIWNTYIDLDNDGERDWLEVVKIAKSLGFEWGGDWTSFKDYPHLQMTGGLSISQLQAGKKPNLKAKSSNTPVSNKKANLKVDGIWGSNTTKALQNVLGTAQDGIISNQPKNSVTEMIVSGITFGKGGSLVVKALQKKVGAKQDGLLGPKTVRKTQGYLLTPVDGVISDPSTMVKAMQRILNAGTF